MSILFDEAADKFDAEEAVFIDSSDVDLSESDGSVPVGPVAEFAARRGTAHPDRDDWTAVPLHEPDGPELSGEYVCYLDHDVRGRIFLVREAGGGPTDVETYGVESFGKTALARRVRFWHSDYAPDTFPDYYDAPVAPREKPRKTVDADGFFDGLEEYVEAEREAAREENRRRARRDDAMTVTATGREGGDVFGFAVENPDEAGYRHVQNEHGIHEGNEVTVRSDETAVEAVVEEIDGTRLSLKVDFDGVGDVTHAGRILGGDGRSFEISLLLNDLPHRREANAVKSVREDDDKREVLVGERELTFGDADALDVEGYDDELNQEQRTAAELALLADDFFCLHGPPGTGKTRTLVEVVRRAANSGERVLVCADSNQAADNLLVGSSTEGEPDEGSLHAYGQHGADEFVVRRLNATNSRDELVRDSYADGAGGADVVVSTNNSAADLPSNFDLALVDEATQATVPSTCIPVSKADGFVLAGDHRQLPPYSASEGPNGSRFGGSLFEHLYAEGGVYEDVGVQLKTQYRMHRDVMRFPNRRFYGRSLRCGRTVEPIDGFEAVVGYDVGGDVGVSGSSYYNRNEADVVAVVLRRLFDAGVAPEEAAVVTPYSAQANVVRERLAEALGRDIGGVTVDTVDSFQGSEREAVVISMVRSNDEGDVGFLGRPEDGPRRLNVAMTRARRFCGIVGDWYSLRGSNCGELYEDLYSYLDDTGRMQNVDARLLEARLDG